MNKKVIALALCILIVSLSLLFVGLNRKDESADSTIVITTWQNDETKKTNSSKKSVKLTLPLSAIPEEYQNDLEAYRELHGYESVKKDSNGNVKIKMSALSYGLLQTKTGMTVINSIYEIAEKKENSFINEVVNIDTENFRSITVSVSAKEYAKAGDSALYEMAESCFYYQLFSEDPQYSCDITVVDSQTNETIEVKSYTN